MSRRWGNLLLCASALSLGVAAASPARPRCARVSWEQLRADQVAQVEPDVFRSCQAADVRRISAAGCKGLTGAQIALAGIDSDKPFDACAGFTPACVANVFPRSWQAVKGACLTQLTPNQMAQLGVNAVSAMPAAAFGGFSWPAFDSLPGDSVSNLTAEQMSSFDDDLFWYIGPQHVSNFHGPACEGMTGLQVNRLGLRGQHSNHTRPCDDMKTECILSVPLSLWNMWRSGCTYWWSDHAIRALSPAHVREWGTGNSMSRYSLERFEDLNPHACSEMTPDQVKRWNAGTHAAANCNARLPKILHGFLPETLAAISPRCVERLFLRNSDIVSASLLSGLCDNCLAFLGSQQLGALPPASCAGLRPGHMERFGSNARVHPCYFYNANECLKLVPVETFAAMTPTCVDFWDRMGGNPDMDSVVDVLSREQFNALSNTSFGAIQSSTFTRMLHRRDGEIMTWFTAEKASWLGINLQGRFGHPCQAMRAEAVDLIPLDAWGGITGACARSWPSNWAGTANPGFALRPEQVMRLPAEAAASFNRNTMSAFSHRDNTRGGCAGLQARHLAVIGTQNNNFRSCQSMLSRCALKIPREELAGLHPRCLQEMQDSTFGLSITIADLNRMQPATVRDGLSPRLSSGFAEEIYGSALVALERDGGLRRELWTAVRDTALLGSVLGYLHKIDRGQLPRWFEFSDDAVIDELEWIQMAHINGTAGSESIEAFRRRFAQLPAEFVFFLSMPALRTLEEKHFEQIPSKEFTAAMRCVQFAELPPDNILAIPSRHWGGFTISGCLGTFSEEHVPRIPLESLAFAIREDPERYASSAVLSCRQFYAYSEEQAYLIRAMVSPEVWDAIWKRCPLRDDL